MKKKIDFVVAGVGFGDINLLINSIIKKNNKYNFIGFIEDDKKKSSKVFGRYKVIGTWKILSNKKYYVFNSVCKNYKVRNLAHKKLNSYGAKFINLIDPTIDTNFTKLGNGIAIFKNVFLGTNTEIGSQSIVHSFSSIGHDVKIGKNCFVGPGAKILGGVTIENDVLIGANAVCLPNSIIKSRSIIGAGSIVSGKVPANSTMFSGLAKRII